MPEPLHSVDALESLAAAEGSLQSWAATRLVLAHPERAPAALPTDPLEQLVVLFRCTSAPGLLARAASSLDGAPLLAGVDLGVEPTEELVAAVSDALSHAAKSRGRSQRARGLGLAVALDAWGHSTPAHLALAARADDADADPGYLALALRVATRAGQGRQTAESIAAEVASGRRPIDWALGALSRLGAPEPLVGGLDDERAAALFGASLASGSAPMFTTAKGSRHRRVAHAVRSLLDGLDGPDVLLLRALAEQVRELPVELVVLAAWRAARTEADDPVAGVLDQCRRDTPTVVASRIAARRAPVDETRLVDSLARHVSLHPGALLASDCDAATDRLLARMAIDDTFATVALLSRGARNEPLILRLLQQPDSLTLGLWLARFCHTEAVLEALLELGPPEDSADIADLAMALADQCDVAALSGLHRLHQLRPVAAVAGPLATLTTRLGATASPG